jgi:hypothetical protein
MATLTRDQQLQLLGVVRTYQQQWDDALQPWGLRAPAPVAYDSVESVSDYRRDQAAKRKKLLPFSETRAAPNDPSFAVSEK